jgi:hypothetical protein
MDKICTSGEIFRTNGEHFAQMEKIFCTDEENFSSIFAQLLHQILPN